MRPKKVPNFGKQKRAFDQVLEAYRRSRANVTLIGCVNINPGGGGGSVDKAKPTPSDFRCDVERIVEALVAVKYHQWFWAAYTWFDSDEYIDREVFAQKMLGDRRHSWEQRLGAKFIEVGLHPTTLYMNHKRVAR
jgi:hypothetical protein